MKVAPTWLVLLPLVCASIACGNGTNVPIDEPVTFGSGGKIPRKMVVAGEYLYVCAGSAGLWRRGAGDEIDWQYLGLADTSLGPSSDYAGVLDLDVRRDDLLVAYFGAAPEVDPDSTVSIWRSTDAGRIWFRSDSGVPESRAVPGEYNVMDCIRRSPDQPDIALAGLWPALYRSTDNGTHWSMSGRRGVFTAGTSMYWHPERPGEAWFYGETSLFAPYLARVTGYGVTVHPLVNFSALGFMSDGVVFDVAFDSGDPNTIYAATSEGTIRTTDGGASWARHTQGAAGTLRFSSMLADPRHTHSFFAAVGRKVYYTSDELMSVTELFSQPVATVASIAFDPQRNRLWIGTSADVHAIQAP